MTSLCANSAKHRPAAGVWSAWGLKSSHRMWESGRPVPEKPGSPASDLYPPVLQLWPCMFFLGLVLLTWLSRSHAAGSLDQGPKPRASLTLLLQQKLAKKKKCIEALIGWAWDWLLDSRIAEQHGRKVLASGLGLAWIFFPSLFIFLYLGLLYSLSQGGSRLHLHFRTWVYCLLIFISPS